MIPYLLLLGFLVLFFGVHLLLIWLHDRRVARKARAVSQAHLAKWQAQLDNPPPVPPEDRFYSDFSLDTSKKRQSPGSS